MEAISGLASELTVVMIAHRVTTLRRCDLVIELDKGRIVAQGTYEQLIERSSALRQAARATSTT
jgi:ATP-binding cassette subfamily B protein